MRRIEWLRGVTAMMAGLLTTVAVGCAGSADSAGTAIDSGSDPAVEQACVPGKQVECACPGGQSGVQACNETGTGFGACEGCSASQTSTGSGGAGPTCGDGTCDATEACDSCADDCGECVPCNIAPSCDTAGVPPPGPAHHADLDVPAMTYVPPAKILERLQQRVAEATPEMRALVAALSSSPRAGESPLVTIAREVFDAHPEAASAVRRQLANAGLSELEVYRSSFPEIAIPPSPKMTPMDATPEEIAACGAPMLRVRVAGITVHEEDDDVANDIVYCAISSEATAGSEVRVTPQTPNLDEGDSFQFSLDSGVVWGQLEPRAPSGNLMITYDCFETDSNDGYSKLLDSIAQAAAQAGAILNDIGQQGWILELGAAILPVISDALALDGDDHLFNASQIITADKQLELTNGASWSVRREGTHYLSDWDWELHMEVWGCAESGDGPSGGQPPN